MDGDKFRKPKVIFYGSIGSPYLVDIEFGMMKNKFIYILYNKNEVLEMIFHRPFNFEIYVMCLKIKLSNNTFKLM